VRPLGFHPPPPPPSPTRGSSFCAGRTRPWPIPGLQGAFKMQSSQWDCASTGPGVRFGLCSRKGQGLASRVPEQDPYPGPSHDGARAPRLAPQWERRSEPYFFTDSTAKSLGSDGNLQFALWKPLGKVEKVFHCGLNAGVRGRSATADPLATSNRAGHPDLPTLEAIILWSPKRIYRASAEIGRREVSLPWDSPGDKKPSTLR
ncbi:hypothetical protein H1C71_015308, partial [Ictidomys tridecemlineatus]